MKLIVFVFISLVGAYLGDFFSWFLFFYVYIPYCWWFFMSEDFRGFLILFLVGCFIAFMWFGGFVRGSFIEFVVGSFLLFSGILMYLIYEHIYDPR